MVKKIFGISYYTGIGQDLNKRWFVRIKVPDYVKGIFVYKKCYGDINKYNTVDERLQEMDKLALQIEIKQEYITGAGSRKIGYVCEAGHTDVIFQFNQCLQDRKCRLRPASYRKYNGLVKNLGLWLALQGYNNLPVGAFTYNHSMAFLSWVLSSKSNESYNAHLILFKSFFTQLITKKIVATNPFNGIKKLPPMNVAPLPFNRPQMEILKNKIPAQDPQLWFFVQFIYYCFIRPGELRLLKLSDINFYENKIQIRPEINKNKKMQWVSIPTQLMEQINIAGLQQYENDFFVFGRYGKPGPVPVGVNAMKLRHQAILKNLKFNINYKMYSWKHTGAVSCARAGMPLKELQLQLRHYSLDQVNHYLSSMLVFESAFVKDSFPSI